MYHGENGNIHTYIEIHLDIGKEKETSEGTSHPDCGPVPIILRHQDIK
jgi:hypothetical protein